MRWKKSTLFRGRLAGLNRIMRTIPATFDFYVLLGPTNLLKLISLSSRLPHHERHSPQDKVELLARAGEVAHGEGLVGGLQALQQR